jgi:hypothetical protein
MDIQELKLNLSYVKASPGTTPLNFKVPAAKIVKQKKKIVELRAQVKDLEAGRGAPAAASHPIHQSIQTESADL